jgi:preprotein translocase subunit SecE
MLEKLKVYLAETRTELRKVTWPTMDELKESTRVVIVATIVLTIFIGVVDQILNRIIQLVLR